MRYPVIVHKDGGSDYGVTVPDFPGVFSGGETLDEALANVQDAIETFYEGEEVERLPDPSPLESVLASEDAEGGAVVLVDVNFDFLEKKAVPVNITVPLYLRKQIDTAAKEQGLTRSAFLITAAKYYMQNRINSMSLSNKKQLLCEIIELCNKIEQLNDNINNNTKLIKEIDPKSIFKNTKNKYILWENFFKNKTDNDVTFLLRAMYSGRDGNDIHSNNISFPDRETAILKITEKTPKRLIQYYNSILNKIN